MCAALPPQLNQAPPPTHTLHMPSTGAIWTCRAQVAGVAGRLAAYEELEEPSMGAEDFSFLAGI